MTQRLPETAGGAPVDWRGLCGELSMALKEALSRAPEPWAPSVYAAHPWILLDRARTLLAQPEPEVVGPTDEELLKLWCSESWDTSEAWGVLKFARAVLARFGGRPAPAPAGEVVGPTDEEVEPWWSNLKSGLTSSPPATAGEAAELVALIRQISMAWAPDTCLLGNMTAGQLTRAAELLERQAVTEESSAAAPVQAPAGEVGELVAWLHGQDGGIGRRAIYARIADLLERQAAPVPVLPEDAQVIEPAERTILVPVPVPVAVSERLPGAEDCDAEGRCWVHQPHEACPESPAWELMSAKYASANYEALCWLPFNTLPLPSGEVA